MQPSCTDLQENVYSMLISGLACPFADSTSCTPAVYPAKVDVWQKCCGVNL